MNHLTPAQILFIHFRVLEETGGNHGIRDLPLLESAVSRPMATFDRNDLYPDLFTKAAALMHGIIKNHPFIDGNKRTAITSASIFLLHNGYALTASNRTLEQFTLQTASEKREISDIAKWFENHSEG
ncbi:MAG: type II toxin-antitoxin system death-on-curing family toxin [Deltaproteobacteria bacterium]|nr:type II toxin-antitoxin system death-on-curing family toxin [Deltaproteobacteria bacterium]